MSEPMGGIIEYLRGTCRSLEEACQMSETTEDALTPEQLGELDDELFLCDSCGWWCGMDEMYNEDGVCDDCFDGEV